MSRARYGVPLRFAGKRVVIPHLRELCESMRRLGVCGEEMEKLVGGLGKVFS